MKPQRTVKGESLWVKNDKSPVQMMFFCVKNTNSITMLAVIVVRIHSVRYYCCCRMVFHNDLNIATALSSCLILQLCQCYSFNSEGSHLVWNSKSLMQWVLTFVIYSLWKSSTLYKWKHWEYVNALFSLMRQLLINHYVFPLLLRWTLSKNFVHSHKRCSRKTGTLSSKLWQI